MNTSFQNEKKIFTVRVFENEKTDAFIYVNFQEI